MTANEKMEEPLFRVGFVSDTHVEKTEESCLLTKLAFELFKAKNVDLMVNLGDLANYHYKEAYALYRRAYNEAFGENPPPQLILYAYHDMKRDRDGVHDWTSAMQEFKEDMQIANDPYDLYVLKGHPFLVFPECADMERYENEIKEAIRRFPGKPVFVLDHIPVYDTVADSRMRHIKEKRLERRRILDRHPQVVHISGHIHVSLRNELNIWQGGFTAVNVATLKSWSGRIVNNYAPGSKKCDEVMLMEVFSDRIVFRRFSVSDGSEIRPDRPWCIPLPFSPGSAPYNIERRRPLSQAPVFPSGSEINVSFEGRPFKQMTLEFDEAEHPDGCYLYRVELSRKDASGRYVPIGFKETYGDFYMKDRTGHAAVSFDAGYFDAAGEYQVTIVPIDFFGNEGEPLHKEITCEEPERGYIVFESFNPMEDCPYYMGDEGNEPVPLKDGFYMFPSENTRLIFPKGAWDAPAGTYFRLVLDMSTEQLDSSSMTLILHSQGVLNYVRPRLVTPSGSNYHYRVVIEFQYNGDEGEYALFLGDGLPGKVAFHYVRIEKTEEHL